MGPVNSPRSASFLKTTNPVDDDLDIAKLQQIKQQIGYDFAVFLRLPTGPHPDPAGLRIVWV
jgi:hypothetical protein